MSDAYNVRPGGSLKLKGGDSSKKKKKTKSSKDRVKDEIVGSSSKLASPSGDERSGASRSGSAGPSTAKTEAERRFEEVQRRRLEQKVRQTAMKSHKERVQEFNEKLEKLSEHHDIPKVGPG